MKVSKAALYSALATAVAGVVIFAAWNPGQQSAEERPYYQGKNLNVILGLGPSAGGTAIGRLVSKHLVEHIPGKPRLVVKNMEGAELMKAHQYVLRSAPKDGTVIYYGKAGFGHIQGSFSLNGTPIRLKRALNLTQTGLSLATNT